MRAVIAAATSPVSAGAQACPPALATSRRAPLPNAVLLNAVRLDAPNIRDGSARVMVSVKKRTRRDGGVALLGATVALLLKR